MENVTSSDSATSRDEEFVAKSVENAIVRYVFPVVIIVGKNHTNHNCSMSLETAHHNTILYYGSETAAYQRQLITEN